MTCVAQFLQVVILVLLYMYANNGSALACQVISSTFGVSISGSSPGPATHVLPGGSVTLNPDTTYTFTIDEEYSSGGPQWSMATITDGTPISACFSSLCQGFPANGRQLDFQTGSAGGIYEIVAADSIGGTAVCFQLNVASTASGAGDPMFIAFHSKQKYHWHGEAAKVFAVLGDRFLQFNAYLVPGHGKGTWMSSFGFRAHNASLAIYANQTVSINRGSPIHYSSASATFKTLHPTFTALKVQRNALRFLAPGWGFSVVFRAAKNNSYDDIPHLDVNVEAMTTSSMAVHGVLGHTFLKGALPVSKHCNPASQGGCMVDGPPSEYYIENNDILGTRWKHSLFMANETFLAIQNIPSPAPLLAVVKSQ